MDSTDTPPPVTPPFAAPPFAAPPVAPPPVATLSAATPPASSERGRIATRTAGLVVLGGLAAGGAFAAVSGISTASSPKPSATTSAPSSTAAPSSTNPAAPGVGHRRGGLGLGRGAGGFGGAGGTITAISGSTITLRTEQGTETVKTTSATKYTKERLSTSLSQLHTGDILRVRAPRPATGAPTPGTGTVTATEIDVVLPELSGRVTKIDNGTLTLVGPDGQIRTVSSTSTTRYYDGATKTTSAAVKVGIYIVAEGPQDSLTHLSADVVSIAPKPGERPAFRGGHPGGNNWSGPK